jgi:hypothetical protein
MPDQSVEVTFDPNAEPQFTFVPNTVTMTKAGKIVLHRRPQDAPWKFKGGSVKMDEWGQFTPSVHGNGSLLHLDDKFTDREMTSHSYMVRVEFELGSGSRDYDSPDPVIVNDPGARLEEES